MTLTEALKKEFGFTDDDISYKPIHWDPKVKAFIAAFEEAALLNGQDGPKI